MRPSPWQMQEIPSLSIRGGAGPSLSSFPHQLVAIAAFPAALVVVASSPLSLHREHHRLQVVYQAAHEQNRLDYYRSCHLRHSTRNYRSGLKTTMIYRHLHLQWGLQMAVLLAKTKYECRNIARSGKRHAERQLWQMLSIRQPIMRRWQMRSHRLGWSSWATIFPWSCQIMEASLAVVVDVKEANGFRRYEKA